MNGAGTIIAAAVLVVFVAALAWVVYRNRTVEQTATTSEVVGHARRVAEDAERVAADARGLYAAVRRTRLANHLAESVEELLDRNDEEPPR